MLFLFNALKASLPTGALVLFTFILIWLRVRKEYKSDSLARYDFSYTINQEGINQKIRKSNMHVEWKDVYKFLEKKDMFLIYVSKNKAIILPKRYFDTDQEIVLFKKLAQVNLPKKKIKIK